MPADVTTANLAAWQQYAATAAAAEPPAPGVLPQRLEWPQVSELSPGEEGVGFSAERR